MEILTWDGININDGTNYDAYFVSPVLGNAPVNAEMVKRHGRFPLIGGVTRPDKTLLLEVIIRAADAIAAIAALRTTFETESGDIKTLVIESTDGTEEYVEAVCEALYEEESHLVFRVSLRVHNDTSWQSTAVQSQTEIVIASDQEWEITNAGDQIARPTITITPLTTQPNTNAYRRFVAVYWQGDAAADHPTDIVNNAWDTAAAVTATKMQADGDDIRVLVNGVFVDYWLDDINTNNTSVWCNLNWQKAVPLTLAVAIASTGTVETVDVNEAIDALPSSGILQIDDELFLYTTKNNGLKRFTILARAAHGTVEAAHIVTDAVKWIQHTIEVQYGNSGATAWPSDAKRKPIFDLTASTNEVWDYLNFGGTGYASGQTWQQPGTWQHSAGAQRPSSAFAYTGYTESQYPGAPDDDPYLTDPWEVIGLYEDTYNTAQPITIAWWLNTPYAIVRANFQDGYKRTETGKATFQARVVSSNNSNVSWTEYSIPDPSADATWEAWSYDANPLSILTAAKQIALKLFSISNTFPYGTDHYVEAGRVTLTFDTDTIPTVYMAPEVGNYTIEATLTHVESGWALQISFAGGIDSSLVINTDSGLITTTTDDSNQFQAVRRFPRPRVEWLPLLPGVNTLRWTEVGVVEMEVGFQWRERRGA